MIYAALIVSFPRLMDFIFRSRIITKVKITSV